MTFDSTVRLTRVDAPREVAFEGAWTGMIRPNGRYFVERAPEGSRVTLNPRPELRGIGRIMEPLIAFMGRRLNREPLETLRQAVERPPVHPMRRRIWRIRFDGSYAVTRSPDAADRSMAAMTSWRRTASAKSGTV
jgi:hypothetical protein